MSSVPELVADARGYASGLLNTATAALNTAVNAVTSTGFTTLSFSGVPLPAPPVLPATLVPPVLDTITLDLPAEPDSTLLFQDISPIETGTLPLLTAVAPTLTLPNKPAALADFLVELPTINTALTFPEPPAELLSPNIEVPVIATRTMPTKPNTNLPSFSAVAPADTTVAPSNLDLSFANAYSGAAPVMITMMDGYVDSMMAKYHPGYSAAKATLEAQLARYMAGGTGINAATEDAIYERERDKVSAEARRVSDASFSEYADRGFTMPPGALAAAVSAARQGGADNLARTAREIRVMAMEMEQKNLQFAVDRSADLRKAAVSSALAYHQNLTSINGQALEYAKNILGSIVELYNITVKAYATRVEGYKAEAVVYETRLKSALAGVELYKIEIQAEEALANVDRAKVEVYKARVEALMVYANVYRARIEAVRGRADLEKLKIEVFGAQVGAFTAKVQAKNAEWQGYRATIDGEQAKGQLFAVQVQGYLGQIQGFKAVIDAKSEAVRATAITNNARAEQLKAIMNSYATVVQARGDVAKTKLENNRQSVISFQAQSQATIANAQIRNEYYRSTGEISIKNAALSIEAIVKGAELTRAYSNSIAQLHNANATIHGSLAGSAMAGMNSLAAETLTT